MSINVTMKLAPELDPGFLPAALWNREYRKLVAAAGTKAVVRLAVCLERANGTVSRFDTAILPEEESNDALNLRYVERIVKFLLWARGGWKVTIGGSAKIAAGLARLYSADGERAFDHKVMGRTIYDRDFTVESCAYDAAPAGKEISVKLGGHFDGCRIGFDLGGSDRKCAAVKDGETVHSEEVVWDPYFQKDINYHRARDHRFAEAGRRPSSPASTRSAAAPRASMWTNQPRIASLFRGIPEAEFATRVRPIFLEIAKEFPGVPFIVLNDGEVTALAGAVSLGENGCSASRWEPARRSAMSVPTAA